MDEFNLTKLSKKISQVLRHESWLYELEIDDEGWVDAQSLLHILHHEYPNLTLSDIESMILASSKKRHELIDGRIRAIYGHSILLKAKKQMREPPEVLFHGTALRNMDSIKRNGLLPMKRQYVHLSIDAENAKLVGKRKSSHPIVLTISSREAYRNGVKFYFGSQQVWLADIIPFKYIKSI